ncbi:MAG: cbb3-type cytochrome oxidase assembly protein CcoS [Saprospiraceae bacterium]|nr:cbb3-type cytochrome oxidase assembly protein CcoS [Saprospiraceae bacterium]
MSVIIILLCVSFLISLGFFSFLERKDGQYDDSVSPANKILFDTKILKTSKMNIEKFSYDNKMPRLFAMACVFWGAVGMLLGL